MASNYGQNDWMAKLIDGTPLNQINLVGTYRSQYGDASILEQLNRGIRFFDLRLSADGSFENALRSISGFLGSHPTEFAVVQIKHELGGKATAEDDRGRDFLTVFQQALTDQPDIRTSVYYTDNQPADRVPISQVRGRMLLLADNDLQLGYAFDSPLTIDPTTFWPAGISTRISRLPGPAGAPDPSSWSSLDAADNPWVKVNSALQLALARDRLADGLVSAAFTRALFFQTWLAGDQAAGSAAVAAYFAQGLLQLLAHGANASIAPQQGLYLNLGLVVMDNVGLHQDVISGLIAANQSVHV
ncbi:hypothetical protein MBLNU459_g2423t1 [Dothideomycetes sp. NU459]